MPLRTGRQNVDKAIWAFVPGKTIAQSASKLGGTPGRACSSAEVRFGVKAPPGLKIRSDPLPIAGGRDVRSVRKRRVL